MSAVQHDNLTLRQFVEGFFAPIAAHFADPSVSEIMINGPSLVFIERKGTISKSEARFPHRAALVSALRATAQYLGRPFDELHPILEGRLPDGSRIEAILDPVAQAGPCVAIRRHQTASVTLAQLVQWGALSQQVVQLLQGYSIGAKNIIVSGGTGTGKTSLLRCIASLIPADLRIVTIEDARELALPHPNVVSLEARPADERGRGALDTGQLFAATLRLRPDRIVIGELRGAEAMDLVQAMTSGHGGCLSTLHASTPLDALRRLETLALFRGLSLPLAALRSQIAAAVDVIVQVERTRDGRRRVSEVVEVLPLDQQGQYQLKPAAVRARGDVLQVVDGAA
ncbi:MAG TPA: ATPase, T2SS/T4P/T4SS family [Polyangiaceae bacterium]|nr:ATPase, T2SS/T4P/T4SS family [Polyangiaceae bacterium]